MKRGGPLNRYTRLKSTSMCKGARPRGARKSKRTPAQERKAEEDRVLAASKRIVWRRDRGRCRRCRKQGHHVHHLVSRNRGRGWAGLHQPPNLVLMCFKCHEKVHDHHVLDWRDWILPRPKEAA